MNAPSPIDTGDLDAIVTTVWESLFGEPAVALTPAPVTGDAVSARVDIHGGWTGSVVVTCERDVAAGLTRELLLLPADCVPDRGEVRDALGEIANIVAGNVKALLPAPAALGLPEVAEDDAPATPDGTVTAATYLATAGNLRIDLTSEAS